MLSTLGNERYLILQLRLLKTINCRILVTLFLFLFVFQLLTSICEFVNILLVLISKKKVIVNRRFFNKLYYDVNKCSLTCWKVDRKEICVVTKIIKTIMAVIWCRHWDTNVCQPLTSCFHSDQPSGNRPLAG
jgi:hypothetical protein